MSARVPGEPRQGWIDWLCMAGVCALVIWTILAIGIGQ